MKNNMNFKHKFLYIQKHLRNGLIIFMAIGLLVIGLLAYIINKNQKYYDKKYTALTYSAKASTNYEVFLLPNQIYSEKSIGENNIYVTKLMDYIDVHFLFEISSDKSAKIKGQYNIIANLTGTLPSLRGTKKILEKEYVLFPDTSFNGEDNLISIKKNIPIKLDNYSNYIDMVKQNLEFGFDNNLSILFSISYELETEEGNVKENVVSVLEIPISERYFEISGNSLAQKKGTIEGVKKDISPLFSKKMMACWVGGGICVIILLFMIIFSAPLIIDPLHKMIKQIFKNYGSRMVGLTGNMDVDTKSWVEVASIEDMVRISDDLSKPILYKKGISIEEVCRFYVIDESDIYILNINKALQSTAIESSPPNFQKGLQLS